MERESTIRDVPWDLTMRLRSLELEMLERAMTALESQKAQLILSDTVQRYLGLADDREDDEVDFS